MDRHVILAALRAIHMEIATRFEAVERELQELKEAATIEIDLDVDEDDESEETDDETETDSDSVASGGSCPAGIGLERDGSLKAFWREVISETYLT